MMKALYKEDDASEVQRKQTERSFHYSTQVHKLNRVPDVPNRSIRVPG